MPVLNSEVVATKATTNAALANPQTTAIHLIDSVCKSHRLTIRSSYGAELLAAGAEPAKAPKYTMLKVALDSGAGAHVSNRSDAPGYPIQPSAMSRGGAAFLAADGGRIANYGEVKANMVSFDSTGKGTSDQLAL